MTHSISPSVLTVLQLYYPQQNQNSPATQSIPTPLPESLKDLPFDTIRALSHAPFLPTYSVDSSFFVSGEEFFEDNPLIAASFQPETQQKYSIALENFRNSAPAFETSPLSLDQRLSIYIQERFLQNPRPGQRQEMANLLCMILIMYLTLKNDYLGMARRCLSGWKVLKPARSATPLTKNLVLAFAWHLITHKQNHSAVILIISFAGCLRVSEALKLRWRNVALPGDLTLADYGPHVAGLNIKDAKTARHTGRLQFVKIDDAQAVKFLQTLHNSTPDHSGTIADVSYQQYSNDLEKTAKYFGLGDAAFASHSARIGKATQDYIRGVPVDQITIAGRWKSLNSLRFYLNNGRAWILDMNMPIHIQNHVTESATKMQNLIEH